MNDFVYLNPMKDLHDSAGFYEMVLYNLLKVREIYGLEQTEQDVDLLIG